ncbi:hypothetical protein ACOME3_000432 [Neoechinorhynchus agilis]
MSSTLISSRNIRRPPPYSRLNYAVSRLFDIGYLSNVIKLNVTSTSSSGVKFVTSGKLFMDTQKAIGGLETRFVTADKASFSPATGSRAGSIRTSYISDIINAQAGFELNQRQWEPLLTYSIVTSRFSRGSSNLWLFGCSFSYNLTKSNFKKSSLCIGFDASDFSVRTSLENQSDVCASLIHSVNPRLQTGVQMKWNPNSDKTNLYFAACYEVDPSLSLKIKIANLRHIGISCTHALRPGVALTMSTNLDSLNINQGDHKLGFGIDVQC